MIYIRPLGCICNLKKTVIKKEQLDEAYKAQKKSYQYD